MKKTLLATTALAFVAAHASAVDVELYGQVNKGLFAYDDGANTDVVVVDNDLSSTRFGFKGAQALDNGLTASVLFEGEMQSNPSNAFVQGSSVGSSTPASTSPSFDERQARVGLSGNFGGLYIGQQSTAMDGVLTQDLAGAGDVMNADFKKIGGGLELNVARDTINDLGMSSATNRDDSVRYDSPIFAGFQARGSVAQGGDSEVAGFYDGAYGDFKVKGAAGVRFNNTNRSAGLGTVADTEYQASVSVGHSSGLAATVAYDRASLRDGVAGSDPEGWYAKVGYAWDAFEVAADYGHSEHFNAGNGDELKAYGLAAQYNLGNGVSVAGLYRNFDADVASGTTDNIDLYGVNLRVKF